jgi:hypothetical protein
MNIPAWKSRAEYDAWCVANMREFNLLAVKDPAEWERAAQKVEAFLARMKKTDLVDA